eukprot:gene4559-5156_t
MYLLIVCYNTDQANIRSEASNRTRSISELNFPAIYHATGNISIPSAGIREPFEVWYAGKHNKSRIDYYGGTVETYQRADMGEYGTLFEVFPKYDYRSNSHYEGCWKKTGNKKKRVEPQGILPKHVYWPFKMNTSQYKYSGREMIRGKNCSKWTAKIEAFNRTDTYIFYASHDDYDDKVAKPVRFEMHGYDVLLVSYYDHYTIDYDAFGDWKYNASVFDTPTVAKRDNWCQSLHKNKSKPTDRPLNPMGDFIHGDSNFEFKFKHYKKTFNKQYGEETEYRKRMHIARHNIRYIHSMNRKQLGFKLDVNHFTDLSDGEYGSYRGHSFDDLPSNEPFENNIPVLSLDSKELRYDADDEPSQEIEDEEQEPSRDIVRGNNVFDQGAVGNEGVDSNVADKTKSDGKAKHHGIQGIFNAPGNLINRRNKPNSSLEFEKIWNIPEKTPLKPFVMFGMERSDPEHQAPEIETYDENVLNLKDEQLFPVEFRHWYKKRNGKRKQSRWKTTKKKKKIKNKKNKKVSRSVRIPDNLDWRDYGAVGPVQSQGICGSCWSFSTTAAVESAHFLKTGKFEKLSEQQLVDCTWYVPHSKDGNHACMGGWTWKSFAYIEKFGLATSKSYGKYIGTEGSCKTSNVTIGASVDSFMKVKSRDAKALKRAIALYGPATASINTEIKSLKFYSNGIYNDKECNGKTDHSILIVGYGEENGRLYWLVRNSWGTTWGEKGYIKIQNGRCGLLKNPWVIINRPRAKLLWNKTI